MQEIITKIIVGICILIAIALIYRRISNKKRKGGKNCCCDNCAGCPAAQQCQEKKQ